MQAPRCTVYQRDHEFLQKSEMLFGCAHGHSAVDRSDIGSAVLYYKEESLYEIGRQYMMRQRQ